MYIISKCKYKDIEFELIYFLNEKYTNKFICLKNLLNMERYV